LGPRLPKPSEDLAVTLEGKPTPEDRVVGCLAGVAGDGTMLASPVDGHFEFDLLGRPADEGGSELAIQR
jgi:hypothetical protein